MSNHQAINHSLAAETFTLEMEAGLKINGRVKTITNGIQKPAIVFAHGFRGFKDWAFWPDVVDRFAQLGYYTVIFDFSRIAAWEEALEEQRIAAASTINQELLDIGAVVAQLKQGALPLAEEANPGQVALLGHSRSGGSAIIYASEHPGQLQAAIIWNGGASPAHALDDSGLTPVQRAVAEDQQSQAARFDVGAHYARLTLPVLIVQGDKDSERLLSFVERARQLAPHQAYAYIPGANHTFGVTHPYEGPTDQLAAAIDETIYFLGRHLPPIR